VIEDGLDFEHNVADAELIGSPQVRLEHDRKIKLLGAVAARPSVYIRTVRRSPSSVLGDL